MTPNDEGGWLEHTHWVRGLASDVLRDSQLAEDVAQEALLAAWRGGSAPIHDAVELRAWLAATARNIARMKRRTESNRRAREKDVAAQRPNSTGPIDDRIEVQMRVTEAVAALPAEDREVVVLKYFDGLKVHEIAQRLGTTPNAISTRLSRARQKLRASLDDHAADGSSYPSWALLAIGAGTPSKAFLEGALLASTKGSIWLLPLAMKKLLIAAIVFLLLLVAGLRLTASSPDSDELAVNPSVIPATDGDRTVDDLVLVDRPSQRTGILPGDGATPVASQTAPEAAELAGAETASVLVKVLDGDTELPVEGVAVSLYTFTTSRWFDSEEGATDERGECLFKNVPVASSGVTVWRSGPDGENSTTVLPELRAGETVTVFKRIAGGETIRGQVVDELGRGVAGAEIWLSEGNGLPTSAFPAGHADQKGRFELPHATSSQAVGARAQGMEPSLQEVPLVEVNRPEDAEVGVKLVLKGLGGALSGRVVTRSGRPVARALVRIEQAGPPLAGYPVQREEGFAYAPAGLMLRTAADGTFATGTMGSGSFYVTARGRATDLTTQEVALAPGGSVEVELVVGDAGSLSGVVRDHLGAPVAGAYVSTRGGRSGFSAANALTDQGGGYTLPALPTGSVEFEVTTGRAERGVVETIHIDPEKETIWNPSLPAPQTIMGRALSSNGTPLTGFHIRGAAPGETGPMAGFQVDVRSDGSFVAPNCLDAAYDLSLQLPGQWMIKPLVKLEGVQAGSLDAELVAQESSIPRGLLKGVVTDAEGSPLPFELTVKGKDPLVLINRTFSDPGGTFEVPYLPPGRYQLTFDAEGFVSTGLDLASPLLEDAVLELPRVQLVREP